MASVRCYARVRKDGTLMVPKEVRDQLGLLGGEMVEITLSTHDGFPVTTNGNPLEEIIGIGTGGPQYGSQNHDAFLYGKWTA